MYILSYWLKHMIYNCITWLYFLLRKYWKYKTKCDHIFVAEAVHWPSITWPGGNNYTSLCIPWKSFQLCLSWFYVMFSDDFCFASKVILTFYSYYEIIIIGNLYRRLWSHTPNNALETVKLWKRWYCTPSDSLNVSAVTTPERQCLA